MKGKYKNRIEDNVLQGNYKDGQIFYHLDVNKIINILKEAINSNFIDIQKFEEALKSADLNGATFIPDVTTDGILSWSNDKGLPNPEPRNLKGDCNFATFDINIETGELIMNKTEDMLLNFNISDLGNLEVII